MLQAMLYFSSILGFNRNVVIIYYCTQVFLAEATGLPGCDGDKPYEVAVKQLRCEWVC